MTEVQKLKEQAQEVFAQTFAEFAKPEHANNTKTYSATGNNSGFASDAWAEYCIAGQEKPLHTTIDLAALPYKMKARIIGYNFATTTDSSGKDVPVLDAQGKKMPKDFLNLVDLPITVTKKNGSRESKVIQVAQIVAAIVYRDVITSVIQEDSEMCLKLTINEKSPAYCRTRLYEGKEFMKVIGDTGEKYEDVTREIDEKIAAINA
jgi:hypothetical protein